MEGIGCRKVADSISLIAAMATKTFANDRNPVRCALFLIIVIVLLNSLMFSDYLCLPTVVSAVLFCFTTLLIAFAWHASTLTPSKSHSVKSLISQYFFQFLLLYLGSSAYKRFSRASKNLGSAQEKVLRHILSKNRNTRYGLAHGFREIISREEYVKSVPLTMYSDYEPYIRDIVNCGNVKQVLTADDVVFLAISSGTSGRNKTIPLTEFTKQTAAREVGPLVFYHQAVTEGLSLRRVFLLSYRADTTWSRSGIELGPVSAHIGRYPPFAVTPSEVYHLADEHLVLHLHAIFGLAERDVGRMESLMSTLVYSFWRHVETYWRIICDEIETGRLSLPLSIGGESDLGKLDAIARKHFRPDPDRARQLREEFAGGFVGIAKRIWPGIRSVRMVTSGCFAHHARHLRRNYMRGVEQRSHLHAASEGFIGINVSTENESSEPQYTLFPEYGFVEFIEESRIGEDQPETVFAEQVRRNTSYEIVYSSQTGLYRYRTGDVVKIVSFFNDCPTYTFAYRVGQMLNLYWEKTPEAVFYDAICHAVDSIEGLVLIDYSATEDISVPSLADMNGATKHYVLFIELEVNEREVRLQDDILKKFDESLCLIFDLYSTLRHSRSIGPMRVYQVRQGAFERVRASLLAGSGKLHYSSSPQYKVPRVSRDDSFLQLLVKEILT